MSFVDRAIEGVIAREKGYVNDPRDTGGETNYGITEAVARQNGYTGAMRDLPLSLATRIYRDKYWAAPGFDKVAEISEPVAAELLDTGVNMGPGWAVRFLQRSLNVFSQNGELYDRVTVDGGLGPATLGALRGYMRARARSNGEAVLLRALNGLQAVRYIELTEQRPQNASFTFGWFAHRVGL